MLEQRRKKVVRAMAGVLVVFGLSLVYFLFFNSGLEVTSDTSAPQAQVIVYNSSVHQIRDVSVNYVKSGQEVVIQKIPTLDPGASLAFPLSPDYVENGRIAIHVSAPFHLSKQISIDARPFDPSSANVSFSFQYPTLGFANQAVDARVDACNNESFSIATNLALLLDDTSLGADPAPIPFVLAPGVCTGQTISFIPVRASPTLSFKIRVSTPSAVLVEKSHTMEIVSTADSNAQVGA